MKNNLYDKYALVIAQENKGAFKEIKPYLVPRCDYLHRPEQGDTVIVDTPTGDTEATVLSVFSLITDDIFKLITTLYNTDDFSRVLYLVKKELLNYDD